MGRQKRLKKLRKAAKGLPPMFTTAVIGTKMPGHEIIKSSEDGSAVDGEGKPIDPDQVYRSKSVVAVQVNHYRKLKHYDKAYGMAGVVNYGHAIIDRDLANKMRERQAEEQKNEEVSDEQK